jgi:uncharacterized protein with HEPN domain
MKPPERESRLWHSATACEKVLRVTEGKSFDEYAGDDLLPDVVIRQLTIVGEAVARIAKTDPEVAPQLGDYPRIISFRNQLVHNYPQVNQQFVWAIVQTEVPVLLDRVRTLLPGS